VSSSNDGNRKLAALAGGEESFLHPYFLSRVLFTARCRENLSEGSSRNTEDSRRAEFPLQQALSRAQNLDPVNRVSYLESRCYMLNTLLRDSDTMSMAHGLEVRVPLIDHRLTQSILALPGTSKLDRRVPKKLLVRALRGALPDKIVHRPKRGFTLPFETWLRGELRPEIERSLRSIGGSALGALVSQSAALEVWAEFLRGRTSWSRPWSLYVLQKWCERHLSN
jgi:asparagine synthase (glutamine-hydrolysing)